MANRIDGDPIALPDVWHWDVFTLDEQGQFTSCTSGEIAGTYSDETAIRTLKKKMGLTGKRVQVRDGGGTYEIQTPELYGAISQESVQQIRVVTDSFEDILLGLTRAIILPHQDGAYSSLDQILFVEYDTNPYRSYQEGPRTVLAQITNLELERTLIPEHWLVSFALCPASK